MLAEPRDTNAWFLIRSTAVVLPPGRLIWLGGLATGVEPDNHVAEYGFVNVAVAGPASATRSATAVKSAISPDPTGRDRCETTNDMIPLRSPLDGAGWLIADRDSSVRRGPSRVGQPTLAGTGADTRRNPTGPRRSAPRTMGPWWRRPKPAGSVRRCVRVASPATSTMADRRRSPGDGRTPMSLETGDVERVLDAIAHRLNVADRLAPAGDDLVVALAGVAATALDAQAASIALHDPATERLVFRAAAGPAAGDIVGMAIEPEVGIAGYVFTTGQPLAVADVAADPRFERSVAEASGYVPVVAAGRADRRRAGDARACSRRSTAGAARSPCTTSTSPRRSPAVAAAVGAAAHRA